MPVWLVACEGFLHGWQMVISFLFPPKAEREGVGWEQALASLLYKSTNPIMRAPPTYSHINLVIAQKP